jgi:hypothetical protein
MGCAVAAKALEMYKSPAKNPNLVEKKQKEELFIGWPDSRAS